MYAHEKTLLSSRTTRLTLQIRAFTNYKYGAIRLSSNRTNVISPVSTRLCRSGKCKLCQFYDYDYIDCYPTPIQTDE